MFAVFRSARKRCYQSSAALAFLALAACEPIDLSSLGGSSSGQAIDPDAPVAVALLVPRGGGNQGDDLLAQSLENAARLAVAELKGAKIDLRVYGTAGNPQTAVSQAEQAVADGAKVILGPVYAEAANAVGVAMSDNNVNVLSFSNNASIAGGNVFILGPTFGNTANRLMGYAASKGKNKIVVVHATDVAGQLGRNAIQLATNGNSAQVVGTVDYELSQEGVSAAVPRIKAAVESAGADAVFFTSTPSGALPLYAGLLPGAGVRQPDTQFIGLTRWDIPPQTLSLPGLQAGLFAMPDPTRTAAFSARYQSAYSAAPHPIGGLAFDGIAAIGALVAQGNRDALTRGALTQANGFQGVTGVFRLRPDGTNQRALAVATIRDNKAVIIDAAQQSFSGF
ncbi:MAG: penicillin-binding protein activator [Aliishimia sp.]